MGKKPTVTPKAAKTKPTKPRASPQKKAKVAQVEEVAVKSDRELQSGFLTSMNYKSKSKRPDATQAQQLLEATNVC